MAKHVLLPVDPDEKPSWDKALPEAVAQARQRNAMLHIMTVVPTFGSSIVANYFPKNFAEKAVADARQQLQTLVKNELPADVPHELIVAHGRIHQQICRVAKEIGVDLIVMESHQPEWSDTFLAPNAALVLQHAPMSVLVVR